MFNVTSSWKSSFPNAHVGVLVMRDIANTAQHLKLEKVKTELEEQLRAKFSTQDRAALSNHPVLRVYDEYYKRFKKTYQVQLQLESILWKGKSIPSVSALVEAMFMAEMKNLLLTAGHDLATLHLPLTLDVTKGTESYIPLRGNEQTLKAGDMMISDGQGIISNIIYGPDQRTQISASTQNVVFTTYTPAGIDEQILTQHLQDMRDYVMVIAPEARVELLNIYSG